MSVVSRGRVLLQKGYGLAQLEPRRAVDPEKTLFRIASISKTFTYIMAMQLKAEGRLDLDARADAYLPDALKFDGDGFAPPRIIDLMQHTAGFEDSGRRIHPRKCVDQVLDANLARSVGESDVECIIAALQHGLVDPDGLARLRVLGH
mgnify:CR=1 FL=1